MRRTVTVLVGVAGLAAITACGADTVSDDGATGSASPPSTTSTPTMEAPPFPDDTSEQYVESSYRSLLGFTDISVEAGEGFDRIVMELNQEGTPGWFANYVDEPVMDGSGEIADLDGQAVLDIYASGTTWPVKGYYSGPDHVAVPDGGVVEDVFVVGTFEGNTQVLVGLEGDAAPFRVFTLTDPTRLVVDVKDDD